MLQRLQAIDTKAPVGTVACLSFVHDALYRAAGVFSRGRRTRSVLWRDDVAVNRYRRVFSREIEPFPYQGSCSSVPGVSENSSRRFVPAAFGKHLTPIHELGEL